MAYKKMNKKYKKEWIEALESGKYRQTQGVLCDSNLDTKRREYCCLGVLCEVAGVPRERNEFKENFYDGKPGLLSNKLTKRFGITRAAHNKLTELNDEEQEDNNNKPYNFKQIAQWISKNL